MEFKKDLQEIRKDVDAQKITTSKGAEEVYAETRAIAEVKATADILEDSTKALQTKLNQKVAEYIENSEEVANKINETGARLVDKGLEAQENQADAQITKSEDAKIDADFSKNKSEYLYHGIDHKIVEKWKRNLLLIINDIWFVIWAIVSLFTIVPVSTFLSRIKALKGIVKGCAVAIGIVMLLAILVGITFAVLRVCGIQIFG